MGAALYDEQLYRQAGIDPKTVIPKKRYIGKNCKTDLKDDLKKVLRIIDEQDAVNRYVWYNLPANLTSQELERMIYYKGQLCFFYMKDLDQFYFMPYALDGTIDFYGRYNTIHPVPMTSGTDDKQGKAQAELLSQIKLNCIYNPVIPAGIDISNIAPEEHYLILEALNIDPTTSAVLLHDYSKQLSQNIIPRKDLNEAIIDVEAECIPFMRTSMLVGTGVKGMRVNDANQADAVEVGARSIENAALNGKPWVPVVGNIEFQELTDGTPLAAQDYMLAMQSLENFRLSTYGIDNGGLFEKKAHQLQSEADLNGGPVGLVLQDGLSIRQHFCNVVNTIWQLNMWCEPAENIIGADTNGDGVLYDRNENGENGGTNDDENISDL